ncbi:MAG: tetracycline resistance MFS efflux pump [Herpetosiphon sp.]
MPVRKASLAFIFVTLFIDVMGAGIVIPILPQLVASFMHGDVSAAARYYGYFIATFALLQFLFAPVLGSLSDHFGRRPVLLISLFGAGLDYLLLSFAPNLWVLFIGRIVAGITAANFTAANAYIADISPPERRAQNYGIVGAAFGLGFIIGPAIGGFLGAYGPRVPFMAAGALTLLNWLYGFFVLPESLAVENRRRFALRNVNPIASLSALRRHRGVLGLTAVIVCSNLAMQALASTWVLYNSYRFAWGPKQQGISLAVFGIMSAIVQAGLLRFLVAWLGERRLVVISLISTIASFILYGVATQGWMMYAILVVTALSAAAQPASQGLISNRVGADEQGAVQGALASLFSLAGIVSPLIATALFSYYTAAERVVKVPGAAFFYGAILTIVAFCCALWTFTRVSSTEPNVAVG